MTINLLVGVIYAWSVFVLPLHEKYGWSMSQLALAYTFASATMMVVNLTIVPKLKKKVALKKILFIGGILYGGGIIASGFVSNIYLFYLTFSFVGGAGSTLLYPVLMTYSQELYPEKTGFSSGMMALGYGLSAVVWATVSSKIYVFTGDISLTLIILGCAFLVGVIIISRFVTEISAEVKTQVEKAEIVEREVFLYEKSRKEMLRDPLFPLVYICMIVGSVCGNMIITQGSPIMQTTFAMKPEVAALLVSLFSLGNTLGRPVWGRVSDRIGRITSFVALHTMMAISMAILFVCRVEVIFVGAMFLAMVCYGGIATLIVPMTSDFWGAKYITENYGVTYSIFAVSTIIGAPLIAKILEMTGEYKAAFLVGLVMALIGIAVTLILNKKVRNIKKGAC